MGLRLWCVMINAHDRLLLPFCSFSARRSLLATMHLACHVTRDLATKCSGSTQTAPWRATNVPADMQRPLQIKRVLCMVFDKFFILSWWYRTLQRGSFLWVERTCRWNQHIDDLIAPLQVWQFIGEDRTCLLLASDRAQINHFWGVEAL